MTTIVCSTTEMCADRQFTVMGQMKTQGRTKIFKVKPHELHFHEEFLIGFCGRASDFIDVIDYYENPEYYKQIPRVRDLAGLVLTKSGQIFQFDTPGKWMSVMGKYAAMGSGAPAAYGALHMGASPKEAVLAASKVCPYTGMGTTLLKF